MLISAAIQNSGNKLSSSSAPSEIVRPASIPSRLILPAPQRPASAQETETQTPEPEQVNTEPETQPVRVQPIYISAPRRVRSSRPVTSVRRQNQALRLQAASAPSAISGFGNGSNSNANALAAGVTPEANGGNTNNQSDVMGAINAANSLLQPNDANNNDPNG